MFENIEWLWGVQYVKQESKGIHRQTYFKKVSKTNNEQTNDLDIQIIKRASMQASEQASKQHTNNNLID